jgi:hypothetical protein
MTSDQVEEGSERTIKIPRFEMRVSKAFQRLWQTVRFHIKEQLNARTLPITKKHTWSFVLACTLFNPAMKQMTLRCEEEKKPQDLAAQQAAEEMKEEIIRKMKEFVDVPE